jgi:hypothetical protein
MNKDLSQVRITKETKTKIEKLALKFGFKQVTILEYLLNGKISLKELK